MYYPKISIVTPNYNQVSFIEATIQSVLSQNYPNLEYIIIDGGSTDGSVEIIKKYESELAYWVSEPDNGMYEAIQKGFDRSTGEIMAWLNSDDMYHPKSLYTVADVFNTLKNVDWITGIPTIYDEYGRIVEIGENSKWSKYDFYSNNYNWIQQESTFWRRSIWNKINSTLNISLKYAGDFDLWIRFFDVAELYTIPALLGGFRVQRTGQLSVVQIDSYEKEVIACLDKIQISEQEKLVVKRYKKQLKFARYLEKFKIINSKFLLNRFCGRFNIYPKKVIFVRELQQFKLQ